MAAIGRARNPRRWLDRRRERRVADEWIAHGFGARYGWRVAELTSDRERRLLARELRSVIAEVRGSRLPGPAPLRGGVLRPHVEILEAIAERLGALDAPIGAAGVIAVQELLTSPGSVLYEPCDDCLPQLASVLSRLEAS